MENATIYNYARMCKTNETSIETCRMCPLHEINNGEQLDCDLFVKKFPERANKIILKWCKEHPARWTKMSERERLIELLLESEPIKERDLDDGWGDNEISDIAEYLLENGVIVPPVKIGDTLYMIVEKRAKISREYFHFIKKTKLTFLNLERVLKYWGKTVFLTKEETEQAIQALKGGATNE